MDEGGPLLNQIMDNPVNNSVVAFGSAIGLAGLIMGNLWAYVDGLFDWFSIGVGIVIALLVFMAVPGRMEIIGRPKRVEVTDTGAIMHQKLGRKPVFVPWSAIVKLNFRPCAPSERTWTSRDGFLFVTEKKSFTLNWKIAEAIRERYWAQYGRYPPNESVGTSAPKPASGPYGSR
jgi:hypothetical protein